MSFRKSKKSYGLNQKLSQLKRRYVLLLIATILIWCCFCAIVNVILVSSNQQATTFWGVINIAFAIALPFILHAILDYWYRNERIEMKLFLSYSMTFIWQYAIAFFVGMIILVYVFSVFFSDSETNISIGALILSYALEIVVCSLIFDIPFILDSLWWRSQAQDLQKKTTYAFSQLSPLKDNLKGMKLSDFIDAALSAYTDLAENGDIDSIDFEYCPDDYLETLASMTDSEKQPTENAESTVKTFVGTSELENSSNNENVIMTIPEQKISASELKQSTEAEKPKQKRKKLFPHIKQSILGLIKRKDTGEKTTGKTKPILIVACSVTTCLAIAFGVLFFVQNNKIENYKDKVSSYKETISEKEEENEQLQENYDILESSHTNLTDSYIELQREFDDLKGFKDSEELSDSIKSTFLDNHIGLIDTNSSLMLYHTYDCEFFRDAASYQAHNVEWCKSQGYTACPYCH